MRKSPLLVVIAAGGLVAGLVVSTGLTQGTARPLARVQPGPPRVALLDVNYIFKNHAGFKARKDAFWAEVQRAEQSVRKENQTIRRMMEQLQELQRTKPGSAECKQLDEQITQRRADLQVHLELQRKELLQKEASIYYTVYQEIQQEVYEYAKRNNISLVLRFNGDPMDKEQPDDVLRGVNSSVVWYSPELDITPIILERLNLRAGGAQRTARQSGRSVRPGVPSPY